MVDKSRRAFLTTPQRVVSNASAADRQDPPPRFAQVSIERAPVAKDGTPKPAGVSTRCTCHPDGRFVAEGAPLRWLLNIAYGYRPPTKLQIAEDDRLFLATKYNVNADAGSPYEPPKRQGVLPADAAAMLRTMLEEYFGLRATLTRTSGDVFELHLAREDRTLGPNLRPAEAAVSDNDGSEGRFRDLRRVRTVENGLELRRASMSALSTFLARCPAVGATVVDRTGLTGEYDVDLRFAGSRGRTLYESADVLPPLAQALEDQLYLKLCRIPGAHPVLIVTRVTPTQHPSITPVPIETL